MNYKNYYFQNDKIRLRLWESKDAVPGYSDELDSKCMALVQEEVPLPGQRTTIDLNGNSAAPNPTAPAFTITDLEDNYLGHIHFNYINERHGTFSLGLLITDSQRGKGYGKAMIEFISREYKGQYNVLQVGAGDSPLTIPFYEKCGFSMPKVTNATMEYDGFRLSRKDRVKES